MDISEVACNRPATGEERGVHIFIEQIDLSEARLPVGGLSI